MSGRREVVGVRVAGRGAAEVWTGVYVESATEAVEVARAFGLTPTVEQADGDTRDGERVWCVAVGADRRPAVERHPSQARRVTTTDLSDDEKEAVEEAARRGRVSISRWMADAARERLRGEVDR